MVQKREQSHVAGEAATYTFAVIDYLGNIAVIIDNYNHLHQPFYVPGDQDVSVVGAQCNPLECFGPACDDALVNTQLSNDIGVFLVSATGFRSTNYECRVFLKVSAVRAVTHAS
jgi:hypothetical protein